MLVQSILLLPRIAALLLLKLELQMIVYLFYSSKLEDSNLYTRTYGHKALTESCEMLQPQLRTNLLNLREP